MHDPSTVAFEIRSPFRQAPSQLWPKGYRPALITIWHEDPLNFEGKRGCRDDDSCGWFRPPYTEEQGARIRKLGRSQYSTLFGKQHATREGKDYAYVCYEPSTYDAIYWAWRAINHQEKRQGVWQYGTGLSARELQEIYELDSNPVDNLRMTVAGVKDEETCSDFFMTVFRCWQRFNRPWYKHPRWHFWHWRFQVHPLQKLTRRLFTRCEACGKPFGWNESPVGTWSGDTVWHSGCFPTPAAKVPDAAASVFRAMPEPAPDPVSDTRH
jgi:hypothetical protein